MRVKSILLMLLVTVAVIGATIWAVRERQSATEAASHGGLLFPEFGARANDTAEIEISGPKGRFRIVRQDAAGGDLPSPAEAGEASAGAALGVTSGAPRAPGTEDGRWTMPHKSNYPARADKLRQLALGLAAARMIEPRTDNPALYDRIAVGEPGAPGSDAVSVMLKDTAGQTIAALIVGKTKNPALGAKAGEIHVRKPDEARAWLAAANLDIGGDALDWLERELTKLPRARVREVVIDHADGEKVKIHRANAGQAEFQLEQIPQGHSIAAIHDLNGIAGALEYLAFDDVRRADDIDFAKPTRARLVTFDGLAALIAIVSVDGANWAKIDIDAAKVASDNAAVAAEAAELSARLTGWAYRLGEFPAKNLMRRQAELIKKIEPPPAASEK